LEIPELRPDRAKLHAALALAQFIAH